MQKSLNMTKPRVRIWLDVRDKKERKGKQRTSYPLKLIVTFNNQRRFYDLGYRLSPKEFESIEASKRPTEEEIEIRLKINHNRLRANQIIDKLYPNFSFEEFENKFKNAPKYNDVYSAFEARINELKDSGRPGTAESYKSALNSIKAFENRSTSLSFNQITEPWLIRYKEWMSKKGNSTTTTGIYLRNLRAILNKVQNESEGAKISYPFGRGSGKFTIPKGRSLPIALNSAQVLKIFKYSPPKGSTLERSRDLWLFSYLCNGMNIADLIRLKNKDLKDDVIEFVRKKTHRTQIEEPQAIKIDLAPEALNVIRKWGTHLRDPEAYLFKFMEDGLSPSQELHRARRLVRLINRDLKIIAKELKIEETLTTYTARHTFATMLKNSGKPIEFISECLGHKSTNTTRAYLASFEKKQRREMLSVLIPK